MKKILVLVIALTALSGGAAFAKIHMPVMPGHSGSSMMSGNIIGNKKTHVFHLPGDKGQLPAPQNRVYFRTESQAMAAGYREAGGSSHGAPAKHGIMGHSTPMAHSGTMGHPAPMAHKAPPAKHGLFPIHFHNPFAKKPAPAGTAHQ